MINKIAEKFGIEERCETKAEANPEKKILFDKLSHYRFPTTTKADYSSYAIKNLSRIHELKRKEKIYSTKNNLLYEDQMYLLKHYEKNLTRIDTNITYGLNFKNMEYDVILPYQSPVVLEDFEFCLEYLPSTNPKEKKISMVNSLPLILDSCQEKGFTLKNLSDLLTLLIKKFIPSSEALVKSVKTDHPEEYLKIITDNIDTAAEAENIETLIDDVERLPKETISEVCARARNFHTLKMQLKNPKLDSEELNTRANRAIILNLNGWVTDECWAKVVKWRDPLKRDGKDMQLSEYTDKIIEIERNPKYRPKTKMRGKSKPDYTALASIAHVDGYDEDDDDDDDQHEDDYDSEEGDDENESSEVSFVRTNNRGRGRGRARGRGRNGDQRRSSATSQRQSRPSRRDHPRRRSYSRTYTRTSSFPRKAFYRSPNGTYRNNSTNSSRGRSPSYASSNSSTGSLQKSEYLKRSSNAIISENNRKCLRCAGAHESQFCPRYPYYHQHICSWCFRKYNKALYHSEDNCYFKKEHGRSSNFIEHSPSTLARKYQKRQNNFGQRGSNRGNRSNRFKSPSNDFVKTQFNSGLRGNKSENGARGKK